MVLPFEQLIPALKAGIEKLEVADTAVFGSLLQYGAAAGTAEGSRKPLWVDGFLCGQSY